MGGAVGALIGAAIGNNADAIHNRGYRDRPSYQSNSYNQPSYPDNYGGYDDDRYDDNGGYAPYPRYHNSSY